MLSKQIGFLLFKFLQWRNSNLNFSSVDFLIKSDPDIASLFDRVSDRVLNLKTEKQLLLEKIERLEKELLTLKKEKNGIYI